MVHPALVAGVAATLVDVVGTEVGQQQDMIVVVVGVAVHEQRLVGRGQVGQDRTFGSLRTGRTLVGRVGGQEIFTTAGEDQARNGNCQ